MSWRLLVRPAVERDLREAFLWYESQRDNLGREFIAEVLGVFDSLASNPLLNSRRSKKRDIRWRTTARFPYRVIYQVDLTDYTIVVFAVLHAARHDRHWQERGEA